MKPASGVLWNTLPAAEEAEFAAVQASCVPLLRRGLARA
jgi:hypothetical protein